MSTENSIQVSISSAQLLQQSFLFLLLLLFLFPHDSVPLLLAVPCDRFGSKPVYYASGAAYQSLGSKRY